jgi:hypothetical protein
MASARVNKLTKPQEVFIHELIKGSSQYEAYLKAYPSKKNWKRNSIDCEASKLFKNPKIKQRHDELLNKMRENEQKNTMWTREESIETLRYVIDINKKDLNRIEDAAEEELELLQKQIQENPDKAAMLVQLMLKQRKSRRASQVNNKGITDAVAELNKMQGFNEETINMNGSVVFTGEDELEE